MPRARSRVIGPSSSVPSGSITGTDVVLRAGGVVGLVEIAAAGSPSSFDELADALSHAAAGRAVIAPATRRRRRV
jgi:hypothetical protein